MINKYTVVTFTRTYEQDGKLNYWSHSGDIKVKAGSLDEAANEAKIKVQEDCKTKGIRIGDFLVDHIMEENGNRIQMAAWDESGFPI